jgi:hypothetical protein
VGSGGLFILSVSTLYYYHTTALHNTTDASAIRLCVSKTPHSTVQCVPTSFLHQPAHCVRQAALGSGAHARSYAHSTPTVRIINTAV